MKISKFKQITETKNPENIAFTEFYDNVKKGKWEDAVTAVRIEADQKRRQELKKKLPYVTISGTFSQRNDKGLLEHSGLICIDFDDIEDLDGTRNILESDPYTYCVMVSVSGRGLAAIVRIDPKKHYEAYQGLESYYYGKYNLIADPACKDISRPRYVTYDPNVYLNPDSSKFNLYPEKKTQQKVPTIISSEADFNDLLGFIVESGTDITGDYQQWRDIGFALADKFGEAGLQHYIAVSQFSPKFNQEATEKQYRFCLKSGGKGITISTFFYYAKLAGFNTTSQKTRTIASAAKQAKRNRQGPQGAINMLQEMMGISPNESEDVVRQVFAQNVDERDETELPTVEQIELFIKMNFDFRRNLITRYIENKGLPLLAKDLNTIYLNARKSIGDNVTFDLVDRTINSHNTPDYNPLTEFFAPLMYVSADGYIDRLVDCIQTDNAFDIREYVKKWLVGIVAAAHGTHSPLVLVLTGGQGTGKTEFFRRLLPPELTKYYAESKLDAGKDDEILMTQKLLIMDDEMGGKSKQEDKRLKELTSKQVFSLREPYGRNNVDLQRLAVLCGTTNERQVLSDHTGNRRMIPINVLSINHEMFNNIDKKLLFAEAYQNYIFKYPWQLTKQEVEVLNKGTEEFEQTNTEQELVYANFQLPEDHEETDHTTVRVLSTTEIQSYLANKSRLPIVKNRLTSALTKLGFVYGNNRDQLRRQKKSWRVKMVYADF